MKTFAVAVLAALSISLAAGCGSSDNTISQDQYNAFHAKASAIIASLGKIQPEATACTTNNSSNPPAAFTCLGGLMTKLGAGVGALGTYMGDLSKNVSGACATDLKSASAAANTAKASLDKVAATLNKGQANEIQSAFSSSSPLSGDLQAISTAAAKADKSCNIA